MVYCCTYYKGSALQITLTILATTKKKTKKNPRNKQKRKNNKTKKFDVKKSFNETGSIEIVDLIQVRSFFEDKGGEPHLEINSMADHPSN